MTTVFEKKIRLKEMLVKPEQQQKTVDIPASQMYIKRPIFMNVLFVNHELLK